MRKEEARQYVMDRIAVSGADVDAAKRFILERQGTDTHQWMNEWKAERVPTLPSHIIINAHDSKALLDSVATALSLQVCFLEALMDLVDARLLREAGGVWEFQPSQGWTIQHGSGGAQSSGWSFPELLMKVPQRVTRVWWRDRQAVLTDGDLFVTHMEIGDLDEGVAEALVDAARCFQAHLFLPAVAMLGAAMEGAWIMLGKTLVTIEPSHESSMNLSRIMESKQVGIAKKIGTVLTFYDKAALRPVLGHDKARHRALFDEHLRFGLMAAANWSDVVRHGRNALHWNVDGLVPKTYDATAALMLGAVPHLRAIYAVRRHVEAVLGEGK